MISAACQVNPRFAINLVAEEPVVVIDGNHTYCDGGELRVLCRLLYCKLPRLPSYQGCLVTKVA